MSCSLHNFFNLVSKPALDGFGEGHMPLLLIALLPITPSVSVDNVLLMFLAICNPLSLFVIILLMLGPLYRES